MNDETKFKIQFGPEGQESDALECVSGTMGKPTHGGQKLVKYAVLKGAWESFEHSGRPPEGPGFLVEWGITNCGFGQLTFFTRDGKLMVDDEHMSKESVMKILEAMYETAQMNSYPERYQKEPQC